MFILASDIAFVSLIGFCLVIDVSSNDDNFDRVSSDNNASFYTLNPSSSAGTNDTFKFNDLHSYLNKYFANITSDNASLNSTTLSQICANSFTPFKQDASYFHESTSKVSSNKPDASAVWGFGVIAVTIISLCSVVGICLLPLMKTEIYDKILLFFIALAVGSLSSNVIFHLIPKSFATVSKSASVWQSTVFFGGIYIFYLAENLLEKVFNSPNNHLHSGTDFKTDKSASIKFDDSDATSERNHERMQQNTEIALKLLGVSGGISSSDTTDYSSELSEQPASPRQKCCSLCKNYRSVKTVAWMITIADGMHNFIDGLAIGASFSHSLVHGLSTSIAIFCEEFPHELGDFAILISAGMTMRQAAFYNFASACCCYLGLFVGILVGSDLSSAQWIFALAGGVFLYISLTGMLPEAQAHCTKKSLKHSPWLCLFIKNAGLLSGFAIMMLLSLFEDNIKL